jgi:hypothetical protein
MTANHLLTELIERDKYEPMHVMHHLTMSIFLCAALFGIPVSSAAVTITVDLAVEEGPMSHRANGYLVSVEPDSPASELIEPLRPNSFRGSAGYVLRNYERLRRLGVQEFQLTLGLIFADFSDSIFNINRIGEDGDYGPWIGHVHKIVDQVVARQLSVIWDIYNEPDRADIPLRDNDRLKEGWRLAYHIIKERLPEAIIVGPSVAYYSALRPFLEWSRDERVFPDVIAYHEYGDPAGAPAYLDDLRQFLAASGLSRPVSVNEILGQDFWMIPGYVAGVLATYERAGILSAMRSCWPDMQDTSRLQQENTCENPTLDGLLYVDRASKRPGWHIYKAYADMRGTRISAVTDSTGTHALASVDSARESVHLLMGKYQEPADDETRVLVQNVSRVSFLPASPGRLRVRAERISDVGSAPLENLAVTFDTCVPVERDRAEIMLADFGRMDAYRVVVSSCDAETPHIASP